jgi:hypothetical protein
MAVSRWVKVGGKLLVVGRVMEWIEVDGTNSLLNFIPQALAAQKM